MVRYGLKRLLLAVPLIFVVSLLIFALVLIIPGDPVTLLVGDDATPEQREFVRSELGLDRPMAVRYGEWLQGAVSLDFGVSLRNSEAINDVIVRRIPVTLSLVGGAFVISLGLGVGAGVLAASRPASRLSRAISLLVAGALAIPNFFLGVILALVFAIWFGVLPATGYEPLTEDPSAWAAHMLLPWITLGAAGVGELARQTRASMLEVLELDYVRTARSKGLSQRSVLLKHGLKNGMMPVITALGLQVSRLFALSVIVEAVFALPGIGSLMVGAVTAQDIPLIQGILFGVTLVIIVTNIVVDMSYAYFNPRLRDA